MTDLAATASELRMRIRLTVNGVEREIETALNRTLVDVLREDLDLTGT